MDKPAQWALVGAAWFLALAVALFAFLVWRGMAGHQSSAHAPQVAAGAATPVSGGATTAICPVTGQQVTIGPATPQVDYLGKTYYFSTDKDAQGLDARTRFLMNPDVWLKSHGPTGTP